MSSNDDDDDGDGTCARVYEHNSYNIMNMLGLCVDVYTSKHNMSNHQLQVNFSTEDHEIEIYYKM